MPSRHTQDHIMAGPGRNRSSAFPRWIEAKPTVLQTAIHQHALWPLTCRCSPGRTPTGDGVPRRFRERNTATPHVA
jgi:hypothetical protein